MLLLSSLGLHLDAQISPGDLSYAHSHLEGMGNCTQCHDLGNKVPDHKCLGCHTEIDALISQNKGFHVSIEVTSKTCVDCHNEHHGRKFELTRFDEEKFDHLLAGYELQGEHAVIDCRACHKPDNIKDVEIKKRENTFLGLEQKCLTCHGDFHQQTLSNDCVQCHGFESFRPALKFDHNDADFKLIGEHVSVDCKECHPIENRNGEEFQKFTDLIFNDCKACHSNPHSNSIEGKCTQCHNETSFSTFLGQNRFNHNTTAFELKGNHTQVSCFGCHNINLSAKLIFQELSGIEENNCIKCHEDAHDGKFGLDCAKCHSEESFYALNAIDDFDHSITDYPLKGQHIGVDCKSCHKGRMTEDINFTQCKNCHDDYHNGEFVENGSSPDCINCHVLEQKFDYTTFGLVEHEKAVFALDGAHIATPCFACHVSEDHWSFRDIGKSCIDCHVDVHKDFISPTYYPNQDCTSCHVTETWDDVSFDHNKTNWPLIGMHHRVDCRLCHLGNSQETSNFTEGQKFIDLSTECIQCHDNIHGTQFEIDGATECLRCHDTESWFPNSFNHNKTAFPLDGRHAEISCSECHISELNAKGNMEVIYKLEKLECIDCHS